MAVESALVVARDLDVDLTVSQSGEQRGAERDVVSGGLAAVLHQGIGGVGLGEGDLGGVREVEVID